ncbi:GSCOCG00004217001-RA-CDS [Cotesia congregata]|uniref:Uncharacterized protein n=2 Tax=Cotesia congregata TaxID=51543 RepID=A0A8J2HU90_COTCN|nr:GSCOCG00004217001-RA-CDS [Cotesia congregata]CAG5109137.1 Protein of unknown function [Cotesia congregata]
MNRFQIMVMITAKHPLDRVLSKNAVIGGVVTNNLSSIANHRLINNIYFIDSTKSKLCEAIKNTKMCLLRAAMKFSNNKLVFIISNKQNTKYSSAHRLKVFIIELSNANIICSLVDWYNQRKIRRNSCQEKVVENEEIKLDFIKYIALISLFFTASVMFIICK